MKDFDKPDVIEMSSSVLGYILIVPLGRREILLSHEGAYEASLDLSIPPAAEPVPKFQHSTCTPLVVFASFEDQKITHIADGKRGVSAGTGLTRLNMYKLEKLSCPIDFDKILVGAEARVHFHLRRILGEGGILPPKTCEAFIRRVMELDETIASRLSHPLKRHAALNRLTRRGRTNLALQKESLGLALRISGIPREYLANWQPVSDSQRSFLDNLPNVKTREDTMLLKDFSTLPGFDAFGETTHYGAKVFENPKDPSVRMTVIMANRMSLEQQTGADLIYFNETYRCFVMVQYKAMEEGSDEPEFRWQDGDQFTQEIKRMEDLIAQLKATPSGNSPDSFRFSENPFFLKFCPRVVFNPDDSGLFKGIYLPFDLWKRLEVTGKLKGPEGGNVLTYKNVGRWINNTEFVELVTGSWVGTPVEQSAILSRIIREVLVSGRTVTYAVKHVATEKEG